MSISTPILTTDGKRLGVLAAHLNLELLDAIVLERSGLGETGETYLVDNFNNFVSEARYGGKTFRVASIPLELIQP
ncbi:MAG: hypothetical protein HC806_05120 [Anaerolineae bacterium]|nr:hypothetical protein [Anaerolineae bacterium]